MKLYQAFRHKKYGESDPFKELVVEYPVHIASYASQIDKQLEQLSRKVAKIYKPKELNEDLISEKSGEYLDDAEMEREKEDIESRDILSEEAYQKRLKVVGWLQMKIL